MKRSAILSLKFATATKQDAICSLLAEYRIAVNFYIGLCWDQGGKFNAATLRLLVDSPLTYRYKSQALKQAMGIVVATKKAAKQRGKRVTMPVFAGGADLSTNFLNLSFTPNSFDCWARLSTLTKGKPIWIPIRKTRVFNKWADRGTLIKGGTLFERFGQLYIRVSFDVPVADARKGGPVLGIDRGVNVLLATSDGQLIGENLDKHIDRIKRRQPKSKGRWRAFKARDQYVNECLKQLPFTSFAIFAIEMLKGIKHGRRGKLRRSTNRRFSHWTVGRMGQRIKELCDDNCVSLAQVPPAYTSRLCRKCGCCEKGNRRGTMFKCVQCGHVDHADLSAALNIRDIYRGTISVPTAKVQLVKG